MDADPTLAGLIAAGQFAIAADRYEELTGDTLLATLMRIDGLEWELVDGSPELLIKLVYHENARNMWWTGTCGRHKLGSGTWVDPIEPDGIQEIGVYAVLQTAGYVGDLAASDELANRFYALTCRAMLRSEEVGRVVEDPNNRY